MPAIKSPAQILKLWKNAKTKHLKETKAKELEPQEEFLHKKVSTGLQSLARIAKVKVRGGDVDAEEFNGTRDTVLVTMKKYPLGRRYLERAAELDPEGEIGLKARVLLESTQGMK